MHIRTRTVFSKANMQGRDSILLLLQLCHIGSLFDKFQKLLRTAMLKLMHGIPVSDAVIALSPHNVVT